MEISSWEQKIRFSDCLFIWSSVQYKKYLYLFEEELIISVFFFI